MRSLIRQMPGLEEDERAALLARVVWPDAMFLEASLEMARRELRR